MSNVQISFDGQCYTVEGYSNGDPALAVPRGIKEARMVGCSSLPEFPESLTELTLERCHVDYDLGTLPRLVNLTLHHSTLGLSGTRPPRTRPVHLTARGSAVVDYGMCVPASGSERLLYKMDYQSALLSAGLAGSHTSLSYQLTLSEEETRQLSELAVAGVWRVPPTRVFHLPKGWTGPVKGDPLVAVSHRTTELPPGAKRVAMYHSDIYLEDTADLEALYLFPCYQEYQSLYPGVEKYPLNYDNRETAEIHYRGVAYQIGDPIEDDPLSAEEQARLRRRVALLCPPAK